MLETEVLADRGHPLLAVFSPQLLRDAPAISQQLRREGHAQLVVYVTQQIEQFRQQGEEFAMHHLGSDEELDKVRRGLWSTVPLEERLEGVTPEQLLERLTPEQFVEGLRPEQRERLLALLQQEQEKKRKPKRGKKGSS